MLPAFLADRENKKRRGAYDNEATMYIGDHHSSSFDYADSDDDFDDEDDIVLESKGSSPPPPPSPMAEAQAQIALENERARIAQEKAQRDQQIAAQEKQARIDKARGLGNQAYNAAYDYGGEQITGRGLDQQLADKYGVLNMYGSAVDRARLGIGEEDLNPMASYNTRSMFNDALDTAVGAYRGDMRRSIYDTAGDGFEYNAFGDTADDAILQSILDSRRGDALASIDQARARGQLNDVGYTRAMSQLDQQAQAGMADLQDLGMGVLTGYRDDLRGLRDNEINRVNMLDFTTPYNSDVFGTRLNDRKNDLTNRLQGDIFRTVQDQSFFDPSKIISTSGAIQGFYNPTTAGNKLATGTQTNNPLLDAFTQTNNQNKTAAGSNNGVF